MFKGTLTVKDKRVILHSEPPEEHGTFKIVSSKLSNHWGLWGEAGTPVSTDNLLAYARVCPERCTRILAQENRA